MSMTLFASCGKEKEQALNIAVMPTVEGETIDPELEDKVNEDFRQTVETQIGMPVNLYKSTDYSIGITALAEGNLDVLLVSPMSYYQASVQADIEPLVTFGSAPDTPVYKSVFITRADNDEINDLEDLENKKFAFVDQASSSGYLYPKYELIEELGLESDKLENAGYYFDSVVFSGGHPNTIVSVLNGGVDAGVVAYAMLDYVPMLVEGATADDLKNIGETSIIPNPLFVVRKDLGDELIGELRECYLNYDNSEYFEVVFGSPDVRFELADDSSLEEAETIIKTLGLEAE